MENELGDWWLCPPNKTTRCPENDDAGTGAYSRPIGTHTDPAFSPLTS